MSIHITVEALEISDISVNDKLVLLALAQEANVDGSVNVDVPAIARQVRVSEARVWQALTTLHAQGLCHMSLNLTLTQGAQAA